MTTDEQGRSRLLRAALVAGVVAPTTLAVVITGLTIVQYRFMRGLGWHPLDAPTHDWPSGLSLGPYGALMVGSFIGSGSLLILFGFGLREALPRVRVGALCLGSAGVGLVLMAANTDPTNTTVVRTFHGNLHDAAFALMGISFVCAFLAFARALWPDRAWRAFARYSLASAVVVVPGITLKGVFFYVFLINTLVWVTLLARLLRKGGVIAPHQ